MKEVPTPHAAEPTVIKVDVTENSVEPVHVPAENDVLLVDAAVQPLGIAIVTNEVAPNAAPELLVKVKASWFVVDDAATVDGVTTIDPQPLPVPVEQLTTPTVGLVPIADRLPPPSLVDVVNVLVPPAVGAVTGLPLDP